MSSRRAGATAIVAATLLALTAGAAGGSTVAEPEAERAGKKPPVIFTLFGERMVEPERIFLTANSGPYLDELVWTGWGERRTKATGILVSDCASCAPPERRPATLKLRKPGRCAAKGGTAYRRGKLKSVDESGDPASRPYETGFSVYCPEKD